MRAKTAWTVALLTAALFGAAPVAIAQGMKAKSGGGGGGDGRDVAVSIPLAINQGVGRIEFNLQGMATLGLEVNVAPRGEQIDEETAAETGESMMSSAKGALVVISRYTQETRMAGFYWSLGAGYREADIDWTVRPDENDKQALTQMSLVDDNGAFHHSGKLVGGTGHLRGAYRYVADEWPLLIGAYIGVRHFQATAKDVDAPADPDGTTQVAPMTEHEKNTLVHRHQTAMEAALELGFIF